MTKKVQRYSNKSIQVTFDPVRCIHAAHCVRRLPQVFDVARRPWVDVEGAEVEAIAETVEGCPTGALKFERLDDGKGEEGSPRGSLTVRRNGPLYFRGVMQLHRVGEDPVQESRVALCRCGKSKNKPYCDNAHLEEPFRASGTLRNSSEPESQSTPKDSLDLSFVPNGPLVVKGDLAVSGVEAEAKGRPGTMSLCRCGASDRKPYCDGAHVRVGFRDS